MLQSKWETTERESPFCLIRFGEQKYLRPELRLWQNGNTMARDFAKALYNSKEWEVVRQTALMRDNYLCTKCGRPAEEVHHIVRLSPKNITDTNVTLNLDNLISLCKDCHFEEHRGEHAKGRASKEQQEYMFDENGFLVKVAPVQP